jgi:hypothetical protein
MKRCIPALALATTLLAAGAAVATTVVHMDTRALATRSADIVVGQVTETRSYWDDSKSRILTEVRLRVERRLKGEPAGELVLTQLGGELDGFRYEVPGSPAFARGEEALVFAWRDPSGRAQVNGLAQGKFEVRRDAAGRATVNRALPGLAIANAKTLKAAGGPQAGPVALDDMVREIESALTEAGR